MKLISAVAAFIVASVSLVGARPACADESGVPTASSPNETRAESLGELDSLRRQSLNHLDAGEYELAAREYRDVLAAAAAAYDKQPWLIETELERAKLLARVAAAGPDVQETFREGRRLLGEGNSFYEEDEFGEAEKTMEAAAGKLDEAVGNEPFGLAARTIRARCLLFLGRNDEAADVAREAVRRGTELYGRIHPEIGAVLADLAFAELRTGHPDDGFESMTRSAATLVATAAENKVTISRAWLGLAHFFNESGDHQGAVKAATEAVEAVEGAEGDESTRARVLAKAQLGYAYLDQGKHLLGQRHLTEARDEAEAHPEIPALVTAGAALRSELEKQARRRAAFVVPAPPPKADDPFGEVRSLPAAGALDED